MLALKKIRKEQEISQQKLADKIGVSRSTIAMWETGASQPDNGMLKRMADFFNVSTDYLLGREDAIEKLYPSEEVTYMPVMGTVKAGYNGIAYEEYSEERIPIPKIFLRGGNADDFFLLRISGDSMYPKLIDGDIVLVRKTSAVDNDTIAVILYNGEEGTVKKIKYAEGENWIDLIPINPEYQTKRIEENELENFRILGKVVKLIRDL